MISFSRKTLGYIVCAFLLGITETSIGQRLVYNYNDNWQFYEETLSASPSSQIFVNLPHTWNQQASVGGVNSHRMANYLKMEVFPKEWEKKTVYIRFRGVSQKADFFVNSKYVGGHSSGYTAFAFDISKLLTYGAKNSLWLKANNYPEQNQMPLAGDVNVYGGMFRNVELLVLPKSHIYVDEYATDGVYVTPELLPSGDAEVSVKAKFCLNPGDRVTAIYRLRSMDGQILDSLSEDFRTGRSEVTVQEKSFKITNPVLWNGVENPYLYNLQVELISSSGQGNSTENDAVSVDFGVRTIEIDGDNHFLLNGKPYEIHGVTRYEDWPMYGNALHEIHMEKDMEIIREMGANAVRLAGHPHNDYFLKLCDREGILVWSELPLSGPGYYGLKGFVDSERFMDNGKLQLTEMIQQQYNHPSVCWTGIFSELILRGDNPTSYISELNALAKRLDPLRLTVASSNQDGNINEITDLIGFRKYFGWTEGNVSDLKDWASAVREKFPQLKVALSGYGAGGNIFCQQVTDQKPDAKGTAHPEQWQSQVHEKSWEIISNGKYFWGTFLSSMFDHACPETVVGGVCGVTDDGLVSFDRHQKKDAFYFYKANWNKEDAFVHIAEKRFSKRTDNTQRIKVYSNEKSVSLYLNGTLLSTVENNGTGIFEWNDVKLSAGENRLRAVSDEEIEDTAVLNY